MNKFLLSVHINDISYDERTIHFIIIIMYNYIPFLDTELINVTLNNKTFGCSVLYVLLGRIFYIFPSLMM